MIGGFRVWDKRTKKYEWDREFVLNSSGGLMELHPNHDGTWELSFADENRFIVEYETGAVDAENNMIHSGDIVLFQGEKYITEWDDNYCEFNFKNILNPITSLLFHKTISCSKCKIIGQNHNEK